MRTETAGLCCEECVLRQQGCLWSIWEASGQHLGSCYLVLFSNDNTPKADNEQHKEGREKKTVDGKEEEEEVQQAKQKTSVCTKQEQKATFGYNGKNGEVRYVISNGLCGLLSET